MFAIHSMRSKMRELSHFSSYIPSARTTKDKEIRIPDLFALTVPAALQSAELTFGKIVIKTLRMHVSCMKHHQQNRDRCNWTPHSSERKPHLPIVKFPALFIRVFFGELPSAPTLDEASCGRPRSWRGPGGMITAVTLGRSFSGTILGPTASCATIDLVHIEPRCRWLGSVTRLSTFISRILALACLEQLLNWWLCNEGNPNSYIS